MSLVEPCRPSQALYLSSGGSLPVAEPEIKNILTGVLTYYSRTRQVGHTRCLFSGTGYMHHDMTTRPTVVAINDSFANMVSPGNGLGLLVFAHPEKVYSLPRKPLLWDNSAIEYTLSRALAHIEALEVENRELKNKLGALADEGEAEPIDVERLPAHIEPLTEGGE